MNLSTFLETTGTTQSEMAASVHRSQSVISRIAAGVQEPDPKTARALVKASKGKITMCCLYLPARDVAKWCVCK